MPIARLRGPVEDKGEDWAIITVGGLGVLASIPTSTSESLVIGQPAVLYTHLHVREDAMQLYGFADASERALFVQLIGVSGIGPKVALAVVSSASPDELTRAIALRDSARFQAIPGIGKKTAERIVLELEGAIAESIPATATDAPRELVARDALVELGYSVVEAEQALATVDPDLPVEERVREALRSAA